MPAFYRQSIQNAVNQQINIGKSKHRTTLNREAIGQVVSYCAVAAAHDLWDWGEKESTLLTLKMNNAASRYIMDHDNSGSIVNLRCSSTFTTSPLWTLGRTVPM